MENEKYWIAMLKINKNYFVLGPKNGGGINDFETKEKALNFFTDAYDKAHERGCQGVTSALLTSNLSKPRVLEIDSKSLTEKLFDEEKGIIPVKFDAALGFLTGLTCNRPYEIVENIYNSGEIPKFK